MTYNYDIQYYNKIPLRLIKRNYKNYKAKRYVINETNQNIWIPNSYLLQDGTIKVGVNLDFIFKKKAQQNKLKIAKVIGD